MQRLLFILWLLLPLSTHAETINPLFPKSDVCGKFAVVHINGVDTILVGAQANLTAISTNYGNAHEGHLIKYRLGYNNTITQANDIADAMYRTLAEFPGVDFEDWVNAFYFQIFPSYFPSSLLATISTRLAYYFNIYNRPDTYYERDVVSIAAEAKAQGLINATTRLLIIGHSEGTIIANTLFRRFTSTAFTPHMEAKQVGLMSIAAFVPSVAGTGSQYVTNNNDRPVTMARTAYSAILKGTVSIPHTEPMYYPWRGHNLINKYLTDANSKKQIKDKMKLVFSSLKTTSALADPGFDYGHSHASVIWDDCNPTSFPWGCWVNGVQYFQPYMHYFVPGATAMTISTGPFDQAVTKAVTHAGTCQSMMESKLAQLRAANPSDPYPWVSIPGCGYNPDVYRAMDGDIKQTKTIIQDNRSLPGNRSYASAYVGSVCRR